MPAHAGTDADDDFEDDFEDDDDESGTSLEQLLDSSVGVDDPATVGLLTSGEMTIHGRMPWSSNGTYLVTVDDGADHTQAIYKPESGERPLWDFPGGLWKREVGLHDLAEHLGWHVVPPPIIRREAPMGVGSVQFFVPSHYEQHYFTFRDRPELRRSLEQICLLDLVGNNTDRKGGHCLLGHDERVWAIDNGLSLHAEFKLRTVLWDFAGEPLPTDLVGDLSRLLDGGLPGNLAALLDPFERDAVLSRCRAVIAGGVFPSDPTGHRHPWPLV